MHRYALDDSRIVDEDVDVTHLCVDFLHKSLDIVFLCHVAHITVHILYAGLFVVCQSLFESGLINVVEDDVLDACGHKRLGDVESDTVRSAGDPGIFTFQ